ncbi:MAG: sugar ABC transporter substrate-binding protein [Firmicutes bacterium]|nr:sugar ABC transporter substrate-binding protein [Bacillota bacterium]
MRKTAHVVLSVFCLSLLLAAVVSASTPVTVTVISERREQSYQWQLEMKERCEAQNPGITVDLVSVAGSSLVPKMQTMLAGGVPLDIGYMDPYLVLDWGMQGLLEDLTPFVAKEQRQYRDWFPVGLDLFRVDGALYGIPQDLQIGVIYYNKDLFNEAGVPFPSVDWTYDDLRNMALRLTRRQADGTTDVHGFKIPTGRNYMPVVWSYGGDFLDSWVRPTKFTGRSQEVVNALQYLADLVTSGAVQDKATHDRMSITEAFLQQRIAMGLSNTVAIAEGFVNIRDFEWDVIPLPKGPTGLRVPYINAIGWFVFSSSKVKDEALEFLKFMTSNEALERRVEIAGLVPPSMRIFQTAWLPGRTQPASRHLLHEGLDRARSPFQIQADFFNPIHREVLNTIWGLQAPASAIALIESQINALLNERR